MPENPINKLADQLISKEAQKPQGNIYLHGSYQCPCCYTNLNNQKDWENATGCSNCGKSFVD